MNRKKKNPSQVSSLLNRVIALAIVLFVLVGAFGLTTVYLRHEIANTANSIKQIERNVVVEKRKLAELGAEITRMTTRPALKALNERYAFGLHIPKDDQIVRVSVNVESRLYEKTAGNRLTASTF